MQKYITIRPAAQLKRTEGSEGAWLSSQRFNLNNVAYTTTITELLCF
jgi:hypothetical protein